MILVRLIHFCSREGLLFPQPGNQSVAVDVSGHASEGSRGYDIVCAAVSALAHTLVCSIARIGDIDQRWEEGDGLLRTEVDLAGLTEEKKSFYPFW